LLCVFDGLREHKSLWTTMGHNHTNFNSNWLTCTKKLVDSLEGISWHFYYYKLFTAYFENWDCYSEFTFSTCSSIILSFSFFTITLIILIFSILPQKVIFSAIQGLYESSSNWLTGNSPPGCQNPFPQYSSSVFHLEWEHGSPLGASHFIAAKDGLWKVCWQRTGQCLPFSFLS
jgi:hypothetical protein